MNVRNPIWNKKIKTRHILKNVCIRKCLCKENYHMLLKDFLNIFNYFIIYLFIFYCCSSTVELFSCHNFSLPHPSPLPTLNLSPLWFCPYVLYICSLVTLPFFPQLSPSLLLSGYCQFVLYFNVSGSFLLICLFFWLGST